MELGVRWADSCGTDPWLSDASGEMQDLTCRPTRAGPARRGGPARRAGASGSKIKVSAP